MDYDNQYITEANYLDGLEPDQFDRCIERYIKNYAYKRFGKDSDKINAVERLCHDARLSQANDNSAWLSSLLSTQLLPPYNWAGARTPLHTMKDVSGMRRFGDIVFLPRNAEIIVIGDTHGDLSSTRQIIQEIRNSFAIERGAYVVFLGDYSNNGVKSWQNLIEIINFQKTFPASVVLLSGNHEFRESYLTALNEFLNTHWEHFTATDLPYRLRDRIPQNDNHYGHLRLDLIRSFGFAEGERLYCACADWGLRLPYICIADHLMIAHSLGKLAGDRLNLAELINGKQRDAENIKRLGFEMWHSSRPSAHSALVNNRTMTTELLSEFSHVFGVSRFVVGHCHYRSGDTLRHSNNTLTTIVSSAPFSPDSGHYMYQQMVVERNRKRREENLPSGDANAGYLLFKKDKCDTYTMTLSIVGMD